MYKFSYFFSAICVLGLITGCASSDNVLVSCPEWVLHYNTVYPSSKYIVQEGIGTKSDEAKNNAISEISYYISTEVQGRREINYNSYELIENNKSTIETKRSI